mgnify:CR=1 FL=1
MVRIPDEALVWLVNLGKHFQIPHPGEDGNIKKTNPGIIFNHHPMDLLMIF